MLCQPFGMEAGPVVGDGVAVKHHLWVFRNLRIGSGIYAVAGAVVVRMARKRYLPAADGFAAADKLHLKVAERLIACLIQVQIVAFAVFAEIGLVEGRQGELVQIGHSGNLAAEYLLGHKLIHAGLFAAEGRVGAGADAGEAFGRGHEQDLSFGRLLTDAFDGVVDTAALCFQFCLVKPVKFGIVPRIATKVVDLIEIVGGSPQDVGVIHRRFGCAGGIYLPLDVLSVPLRLVGKTGTAHAVFGDLGVKLLRPIIGGDVGSGYYAERSAEEGDGLFMLVCVAARHDGDQGKKENEPDVFHDKTIFSQI